jgi:hypothetical protein
MSIGGGPGFMTVLPWGGQVPSASAERVGGRKDNQRPRAVEGSGTAGSTALLTRHGPAFLVRRSRAVEPTGHP